MGQRKISGGIGGIVRAWEELDQKKGRRQTWACEIDSQSRGDDELFKYIGVFYVVYNIYGMILFILFAKLSQKRLRWSS